MQKRYIVIFVSIFALSCGGGGGGGSGGGQGQDTTPILSNEPSQTVAETIQSTSYDDLAKHFPQDHQSISSVTEQDAFIESYLSQTQQQQLLNEDEKIALKDKLFSKPPSSLSDVHIEKIWENNLSDGTKDILNKIPDTLKTIEALDMTDATTLESTLEKTMPKFSDAQFKELIKATSELIKNIHVSEFSLDTNGDGRIDRFDFINFIKPAFQEEMTEQDIKAQYLYWSYFLNIDESVFKSRMWGNLDPILPPEVGIPTDQYAKDKKANIVILDFKNMLALEKIEIEEAKTYVKDISFYQLSDDLLTAFKDNIYKPILNDSTRTDELVHIDKVIIAFPKDDSQKLKIKILTKETTPLASALILTPGFYIQHVATQNDTFLQYFWIRSLYAQDQDLGQDQFFKAMDEMMNEGGGTSVEDTFVKSSSISSQSVADLVVQALSLRLIALSQNMEDEFNNLKQQTSGILQTFEGCPEISMDDTLSPQAYSQMNQNVCSFQKLYGAVDKLSARLAVYRSEVERQIEILEHNEKVLSYLFAQSFDPAVYDEIDQRLNKVITMHLIAFAAEVAGLAITILKTAAQKTVGIALKSAFVQKAIEKSVELLLIQAIDALELIHDMAIKKMSAKAVVKIEKILKFCKNLLEWVREGKVDTFVQGFQLLLSFGPNFIKDIVTEENDKFLKELNDSSNKTALELDRTRRLLRGYKAIFNKIAPLYQEARTLVFNIEKSSPTAVMYETTFGCKENYTKEVEELTGAFKREKENLENSFLPLKDKVTIAYREFNSFKQKCGDKRLDYSLAHFRMERICDSLPDSTDCTEEQNKAKAILDAMMGQQQCGSIDAPAIKALTVAKDTLQDKKDAVSQAIESLKNKLDQDMAKKITERENCEVLMKDPQCRFNFTQAMNFDLINLSEIMYDNVVEAKTSVGGVAIACVEEEECTISSVGTESGSNNNTQTFLSDFMDDESAGTSTAVVDTDGDGKPDSCDTDDDNDGILDALDNCPLIDNKTPNLTITTNQNTTTCQVLTTASDSDGDGHVDINDNCPNIYNPLGRDLDKDGEGDACDQCTELKSQLTVSVETDSDVCFNEKTTTKGTPPNTYDVVTYTRNNKTVQLSLNVNGHVLTEQVKCTYTSYSTYESANLFTIFSPPENFTTYGGNNSLSASSSQGNAYVMFVWYAIPIIGLYPLEYKQSKQMGALYPPNYVPRCINNDNSE
ncbi:MAG: hypothetical protein A2Z91_06275 [Deltaproteobacteria bacterium GWA2_38_16]|nr:MAG: hypothetical protein A2Z91_06275 [Deltaproteobacteria bacterium GWA2_38_16]OGQ03694.1 MAG: hypothetical protein A3D19_02505 [Deltaproteobacteria bacterium RIFCSPHIGHO2_02_FULL_38_15]